MASPAFDFEALRPLSVAERVQLVDDVRDSIARDAPDEALPITPELAAKPERRVAEHEHEPNTALPWEEVRAALLDPARPRPLSDRKTSPVVRTPERRLVIRPAAAREITAAYDWYEGQSPGLGAELLRALEERPPTPTWFLTELHASA